MLAVNNKCIAMSPVGEHQLNGPYTVLLMKAVSIWRPFIEITGNANILSLSFIFEQHGMGIIIYGKKCKIAAPANYRYTYNYKDP